LLLATTHPAYTHSTSTAATPAPLPGRTDMWWLPLAVAQARLADGDSASKALAAELDALAAK